LFGCENWCGYEGQNSSVEITYRCFGEVYDDLQADFRFHGVNREIGLVSPGREIKSISFREVDRAANTTLCVVL